MKITDNYEKLVKKSIFNMFHFKISGILNWAFRKFLITSEKVDPNNKWLDYQNITTSQIEASIGLPYLFSLYDSSGSWVNWEKKL